MHHSDALLEVQWGPLLGCPRRMCNSTRMTWKCMLSMKFIWSSFRLRFIYFNDQQSYWQNEQTRKGQFGLTWFFSSFRRRRAWHVTVFIFSTTGKRKPDRWFSPIKNRSMLAILDEKNYFCHFSKNSAPICNDCAATNVTEQITRIKLADGRTWLWKRPFFTWIQENGGVTESNCKRSS